MPEYKTFEDWYNELVGFSFRSERFLDDVLAYRDVDPKRQERLFEQWLRAAFQAGRE